jgi:hypothetical protein
MIALNYSEILTIRDKILILGISMEMSGRGTYNPTPKKFASIQYSLAKKEKENDYSMRL